jgi:ribulose-5-phosphate 4-epimerase/fuculose-1-phosphate aldolase
MPKLLTRRLFVSQALNSPLTTRILATIVGLPPIRIFIRIPAELGRATGVLASLGHASLPCSSNPERFVVKGREYALDALSNMQPEDMTVCDLDGNWIEGHLGARSASR